MTTPCRCGTYVTLITTTTDECDRTPVLNDDKENLVIFTNLLRLILTLLFCHSLYDPPGGVHQQHQLSEEVCHCE